MKFVVEEEIERDLFLLWHFSEDFSFASGLELGTVAEHEQDFHRHEERSGES